MFKKNMLAVALLSAVPIVSLANNGVSYPVPADKFDMRNWKITIPSDINEDGRVDEIEGVAMMSYSHSDFFHLDKDGNLVSTQDVSIKGPVPRVSFEVPPRTLCRLNISLLK